MFGFFMRKKTKREIIINAEGLETRVAILENGGLEEFAVEHPTEKSIVGDIYKGRIQNLEDDLQAAFVDIGLKKNALFITGTWFLITILWRTLRGGMAEGEADRDTEGTNRVISSRRTIPRDQK